MGAILAIVRQVLAVVLDLLGVTQTILGFTSKTAEEHAPYQIEAIVTTSGLSIADPTHGLAAIRSDLDAYRTASNYTVQSILDAVAPVTLPSPAPPTYGGLDPSATADAVWGAADPNSVPANVYGNEIWEPYQLSLLWSYAAIIRHPLAPMFGYTFNDQLSGINSLSFYPAPDWADIRTTDTRLSWLQRTEPNLIWDSGGTGGVPHGAKPTGPFPVADWYFLLTEAEFAALKSSTAAALTPPVWPGLTGVTLGTPVALTNGLSLTSPLDGVLVAITGTLPNAGRYDFGAVTSWTKIGAVMFRTDNGAYEWPISLGPETQVVTPKSIQHPAGAIFRVVGGVTGTVTPWLLSP